MSLTLDQPASPPPRVATLGELDPRSIQRQFVPQVRPWEAEDLTRLAVFQLVGAVVLGVGWWIVSGTGELDKQMLWLRIATAGVLLSGIANGVWLMRGRRLVGLARRVVLHSFEPVTERAAARAAVVSTGALVAVEGTGRYHRSSCALVRGKATTPASREDHVVDGRRACEACCP